MMGFEAWREKGGEGERGSSNDLAVHHIPVPHFHLQSVSFCHSLTTKRGKKRKEEVGRGRKRDEEGKEGEEERGGEGNLQ